ncbi:DUF4254 domain-containing protein [Nocardia callitridis]|uniref:DUF4254 domain-containing protein n=1 Tax=Nocardia callitridis TaxID=648753 RepID=A0ABP9JT40_9NOCA
MFVRERISGSPSLPASPGSVTRLPLPDQRDLVAAFGGHRCVLDDHPMIAWARALAALHRQRHAEPLSTAGIDCRRAELVAAIDRWVAGLPRRGATTHLCTEPLGATVDRMAAAHVHASHLLHTAEKVSDDRVHAAWYRLALLADEWTDMVTGATRSQAREAK